MFSRLLYLVLASLLSASAATVPIRDACADDATILANIPDTAPIQIRHGVVGERIPCYAVSVSQAGDELHGFILGSSLPVIQEFERTRALESHISIPTPEPEQARKKPPLRPIGPPFEPWAGAAADGKRMQIEPGSARVTLVTFWTVESNAARRNVENLMKTESEFRPRGLKSFGFMEAGNAGRANYYLEDMGLDFPQAFDRQGLATKYHADPSKGTTLVVDRSNNVVAISSNPAEIRDAVARLLSLE